MRFRFCAHIDMQKGEVRQDNSDGHVHFPRASAWPRLSNFQIVTFVGDPREDGTGDFHVKLVWMSKYSYPNKCEIMLCYAIFDTAKSHAKHNRNRHMELDHHPSSLGELSLASLLPDLRDLVFYLGDFLQVSATVVVGDLGFEFVDLLLVLPGKFIEKPKERSGDDSG